MAGTVSRDHNGRLAYYGPRADASYWDTLWQSHASREALAVYAAGFLSYFEAPFLAHLPQQGLILEAGCGTGQWVLALRARGRDCIGVDYAARALINAATLFPGTPLVAGNLLRLPVRSGACAAATSLGVVEHDEAGPEPMLAELHRVLEPRGTLLISVPYYNAIRQWRMRRTRPRAVPPELTFYQYAFTREEFDGILDRAGFDVLGHHPYDSRKCVRDDLLSLIPWTPSIVRRIADRLLDTIPAVRAMGHALLYIARKRG